MGLFDKNKPLSLFGGKKTEEPTPEAGVEKTRLFDRLKKAVKSTKENLVTKIEDVVKGKKEISPELLDELEALLIGADIGVQATTEVLEKVRAQLDRKLLKDAEELRNAIKKELLAILNRCSQSAASDVVTPQVKPWVTMIVGVNGTGKTTTIGKLAHYMNNAGKKTLVCASDTFRAAAVEQLNIWAERSGTDIIKAQRGSDPAAVLFDSIRAAKARDVDVLIVDTAGRLHTKVNLMQELEKMRRIAGREVPGAPHEVLLVLDATTGQNGLVQAREFLKASGVTALVVTKLDGTAKGGVVIAIARELQLPIKYIGIGEQMDDLMEFSAEAFIDSLFE
jgi:fused signal recognition particle receptor